VDPKNAQKPAEQRSDESFLVRSPSHLFLLSSPVFDNVPLKRVRQVTDSFSRGHILPV
jgi:hypothetical protein